MKRIAAAALIAIAITGCSTQNEEQPSKETQACESIKSVSPGFLELTWANETLRDPQAPQADKVEAMKTSLDIQAGNAATQPYTCDGPTFDRYLAEYGN